MYIIYQVDLRHVQARIGSNFVQVGVDLKEFYPSVEWDILEAPARRNEEYYPCCNEPYTGKNKDKKKRKLLFYLLVYE